MQQKMRTILSESDPDEYDRVKKEYEKLTKEAKKLLGLEDK